MLMTKNNNHDNISIDDKNNNNNSISNTVDGQKSCITHYKEYTIIPIV